MLFKLSLCLSSEQANLISWSPLEYTRTGRQSTVHIETRTAVRLNVLIAVNGLRVEYQERCCTVYNLFHLLRGKACLGMIQCPLRVHYKYTMQFKIKY